MSDGTTFGASAQSNFTYDGQTLTIVGSSLGATVVDIQGVSGSLFTVTDSLTGPLLEVGSTSSNIFEVHADGYVFTKTASLTGLSASSQSLLIYSFPSTVGNAAFFDYWIRETQSDGKRTGVVSCTWDSTNQTIVHTEFSTTDINASTADLEFDTRLTGSDVHLVADITGSGSWDVKVSARLI